MVTLSGLTRPIAGMAVLAALSLAAPAASAAAAAAARPAAVGLPRLPAPLGLSFGMPPEEVALPVVTAPAPLGAGGSGRPPAVRASAPRPAEPHAGPVAAPTPLLAPRATLPPAPPRPAAEAPPQQVSPDGVGAYVQACEAAFDRISALAAGDQEWLAWRAEHLRGGEGSDFSDDLADRAGLAVAPAPMPASEADGWRSAGLYRFDSADGRRVVCLLFTADGLAQVFLAGHALDGLRDGVIARLENQPRLADFSLTREVRRFSLSLRRPACGLYCRLFGERMLVERRLWLEPRSRILLAAKRRSVVSGFAAVLAGGGAQSEVFDGLPDSFIASIDLGRRAFVLRQPTAGSGPAPRPLPALAPAPVGASREALIDSFLP